VRLRVRELNSFVFNFRPTVLHREHCLARRPIPFGQGSNMDLAQVSLDQNW
jgi:hypothetical protein